MRAPHASGKSVLDAEDANLYITYRIATSIGGITWESNRWASRVHQSNEGHDSVGALSGRGVGCRALENSNGWSMGATL